MSQIKVNETVKTNTNVESDVKVAPPTEYDVMLYNDNSVMFDAVRDVLAVVLQINEQRAMQIAMTVHRVGKGSVYRGPEDLANQYKDALLAEAANQGAGDEMCDFKGYLRMRFEVEKVER